MKDKQELKVQPLSLPHPSGITCVSTPHWNHSLWVTINHMTKEGLLFLKHKRGDPPILYPVALNAPQSLHKPAVYQYLPIINLINILCQRTIHVSVTLETQM